MPISFAHLRSVEPSAIARRLLWHVLSVGFVSRDEAERHEGMDKAGVFVFRTAAGCGQLELGGRNYRLEPSDRCWLLDLRRARTYVPAGRRALRTEGVRFTGPGIETWLELLGDNPAFEMPAEGLTGRLRRLRNLVRRQPPGFEWQLHLELTALMGELLAVRGVFQSPPMTAPPAVARVLDAVHANPARDWRTRELAALAGRSYSRLRDEFHRSQGVTLHAFLRSTRLALARSRLSDPRWAVKEVARQLNFSSEHYFSHWFRRATGLSPSAFRARCRA